MDRFSFPKDDFYLKKWISVLKTIEVEYNYKSSHKICAKHFKAEDILNTVVVKDGENILYEVRSKICIIFIF